MKKIETRLAGPVQVFGHPKGLCFLFFTEMWERFSYYGMQALLILYMIKHLDFTQEKASHVFGLYTGFVYFTPFFGGLIADRFLGRARSVISGACLMALGHFLMGNTIELFADEEVERTIGRYVIPASWVLALNPMFIFILTPFVTRFWGYLAGKGREPSSAGKIVLGVLPIVGAAIIFFIKTGEKQGA